MIQFMAIISQADDQVNEKDNGKDLQRTQEIYQQETINKTSNNTDKRTYPPKAQGLYDPRFEHDACGVGLICRLNGEKSHDIVANGLKILVQDAEDPKSHVSGVVVAPEREGVATVEPSEVRFPALVPASNHDHVDLPSSIDSLSVLPVFVATSIGGKKFPPPERKPGCFAQSPSRSSPSTESSPRSRRSPSGPSWRRWRSRTGPWYSRSRWKGRPGSCTRSTRMRPWRY